MSSPCRPGKACRVQGLVRHSCEHHTVVLSLSTPGATYCSKLPSFTMQTSMPAPSDCCTLCRGRQEALAAFADHADATNDIFHVAAQLLAATLLRAQEQLSSVDQPGAALSCGHTLPLQAGACRQCEHKHL